MATKCFTVVRGKRLRVTRLDECGNPPAGGTADSLVVTKGFVTVELSAVVAEGDDIEQKNANGDICVSDRSRDQFRRWDLSIEFCDVDPSILGMITNVTLEEDWQGDVVGVRQPEGSTIDSFALEVWTGVPGTDCLPGEPSTYGYMLIPFVIGNSLGDITIENGASTFSATAHTKGGGGWGVGPFDVVAIDAANTPGPLDLPVGSREHLILRTTTVEPPEVPAECGAQPMPPGTPTIAAVDPNSGPAAGGTSVTVTGANLTGATGARVGTALATNFAVTSDTGATFTTPSGTAGAQDVTIEHPDGNAVLVGGFTYV